MNKARPLTHAEFVAEFAQVLDVADSRANELVGYFRAMILGGLRARGAVRIEGLGEFTAKWWIPTPLRISQGYRPRLRIKFRPFLQTTERISRWTNIPGTTIEQNRVILASRRAAAQCAGSDAQSPPPATVPPSDTCADSEAISKTPAPGSPSDIPRPVY